MNVKSTIDRLCARAERTASIIWLPFSPPHSRGVARLNVALSQAETEEVRRELFLRSLKMFLRKRTSRYGKEVFGRDESIWLQDGPLVFFQDLGKLTLERGQVHIVQIKGNESVIASYLREIERKGLASRGQGNPRYFHSCAVD